MITVEKIDHRTFKVTVEDRTTTTHTVTVEPSYHKKLAGSGIPAEDLVKKSFDFLLEREPRFLMKVYMLSPVDD